ncbi:HAMP domain-containing sensor histidine kinase [Paenibacillus sp. FSL K6-1217]|uniref:sensor histidine kinase n=1 Tax=Paenibacillus sp. FSL K6-1217 TaxID=2921466 RepID=UPI0032558BC2
MRSIRIRTFTMLCFCFILLLPWIFYVITHFMETKTLSFEQGRLPSETLQRDISEITQRIEQGTDQWTDRDWQTQLYSALDEANMDVLIQSAAGQDIYRSNPERRGSRLSTERFSVIEDGQLLGRVILYYPESNPIQVMSAFAGLLLALFVVGMEMRRFVLKPLEKLGNAARQMATGDWKVRLPISRVTEIAEVRDGFEVMVKGMEQSYRKQAELEKERRFVIAAVAHDLRTPLFALRGYLDGLEQGIAQTPEKMAQYVAVCKDKSAQLDRLVEDLFTFTKIEYMEPELNTEKINLNRVIRNSLDSLSPQARQRGTSVSFHKADGCNIHGDVHLLERAMNNLLDNAVRHTPAGGDIEVQCKQAGDKVEFMIRDTGPGFTAEELEYVFEPLYRGEASRSRATGGSGLGLTISQRIIRQHGGGLAASNHPEGGALLEGWLPAAAFEQQ